MFQDEVLTASMAWMDALWDDDVSLLWSAGRKRHMTRETAWYALGLLLRAKDGDETRAHKALLAVLDQQFDAPGSPFNGTFTRAPEEPHPPSDAEMWIHYDPNWRQFIGTTFAVICDRFAEDLRADLVGLLRGSIERAVDGEAPDRVSPTYANIALMKAWLDAWSGRTEEADSFGRLVSSEFAESGVFLEYNSPTYYGIDLWALALWRSSTPELQRSGAVMESALWHDIARYYHAGLRNLCGPHDRSYGMDMTTHATPLGLWIWSVVGRRTAPFPDTTKRFSHPHDLCFGPCVASVDTSVPADVIGSLSSFTGERSVATTITADPRRVATAWLGNDVMTGGQVGPHSGIGQQQHHHATIHWRRPDGTLGWMRLLPGVEADATAGARVLRITTASTGPIGFEVHPPPRVGVSGWTADGFSATVETNAAGPTVDEAGIVYYAPERDITTFVIRV